MIWDVGDEKHPHQPQRRRKRLMHQIIVLVQILRRRIVSAGGINHNQSEACQKQDDEQKTVIKIVFCFLRFSPSCHLLTPSGCLHIP